jgi:hypothetical protein
MLLLFADAAAEAEASPPASASASRCSCSPMASAVLSDALEIAREPLCRLGEDGGSLPAGSLVSGSRARAAKP